jgi:ADP-heptose:LPS heptosyltransferase
MKTVNKIRTDKYAGLPLVWLASLFYRCRNFIVREKKDVPVRRIVVCKLMGMGTILQSTPLLITLKENFPDARILFVSAEKNTAILGEIKCIDKLLPVKDENFFSGIMSMVKLIFYFWKNRPDLYFDLEVYSRFSTVLTALSFSWRRYGILEGADSMRDTVYSATADILKTPVISTAYLSLASHAGASKLHQELFHFSTVERYSTTKLPSPYIVVNPNASDLRFERRWPAEKYSLLIESLFERFPKHTIVLTGSATESRYVLSVMNGIDISYSNRMVDSSGKLSMKEFISVASAADLMVTNDSGPMHLAMALQIPLVALFGPGSPVHYTMPENATVIYKKIHCSPCVHLHPVSPCGGDNQCMKQISVSEVFDACCLRLESKQETMATL